MNFQISIRISLVMKCLEYLRTQWITFPNWYFCFLSENYKKHKSVPEVVLLSMESHDKNTASNRNWHLYCTFKMEKCLKAPHRNITKHLISKIDIKADIVSSCEILKIILKVRSKGVEGWEKGNVIALYHSSWRYR